MASETRQAAGLPARTVTYAYDYLGNISSMLYPEATQPLEYNYNDLGQLVEIPNFIPSITYRDGLPRTVRYANGVTLSYTYDRNGRLDTRTDTHSGTQLFSLDLNYDQNGNIISRGVNGQVNTYAYDDLNQLIHADVYARQTEQVRFHDYGLGQVHEDYRGDKVVEIQPEDFEVNLDYAATSLSVIFNQVAQGIQRIELMPQEINHRLNNKRYLAIYYKTSGDYQKLNPADWEFVCDPTTGKITITFPNLLTGYEIKIHCLFDDRDGDYLPVKKRGTTSEFANLARSMVRVYRVYERRYEDYIYDGNGNRMSETITTLYPKTYGYTYYPNSDRLKTREASDGTTKWAFVYDNNGNLVEKGNTYTITGDTVVFTTGGEGVVYWQYEYDVFNRMVSVKKNGIVVSRYVYDPSGLRIVKEAAETRIYDYDLGGNVIGEKNLSTGKVYSYVWVTGRHLARVDGIIGGTEEKYFYECDHLRSPMVVTDDTGKVIWRGDYAPFGERIKRITGADVSIFVDTHGFTGKDWDEDVGLYYFNARWYDPELGRFVEEDPIRDPSNPNAYSYVGNNPMGYIDPFGLWRYEVNPETGEVYAIAEKNDTLSGLCAQYYGDSSLYKRLADDNDIKDPDAIKIGQKVKLSDYNKAGRERHGQLLKIGYIYGDVSIDAINKQGFYIWGMINEDELSYLKNYYRTLENLYESGAIIKEQFEKEVRRLDYYTSGGVLWQHIHGGNVEFREDPFYVGMAAYMGIRLIQIFGPTITTSEEFKKLVELIGAEKAKEVARTFRFGQFTMRILEEDTIALRFFGNKANVLGRFLTTAENISSSEFLTRMRLSLGNWNSMQGVAWFKIPAGTTIIEGITSAQFPWLGGGYQIFLPITDLRVMAQWLIGIN